MYYNRIELKYLINSADYLKLMKVYNALIRKYSLLSFDYYCTYMVMNLLF